MTDRHGLLEWLEHREINPEAKLCGIAIVTTGGRPRRIAELAESLNLTLDDVHYAAMSMKSADVGCEDAGTIMLHKGSPWSRMLERYAGTLGADHAQALERAKVAERRAEVAESALERLRGESVSDAVTVASFRRQAVEHCNEIAAQLDVAHRNLAEHTPSQFSRGQADLVGEAVRNLKRRINGIRASDLDTIPRSSLPKESDPEAEALDAAARRQATIDAYREQSLFPCTERPRLRKTQIVRWVPGREPAWWDPGDEEEIVRVAGVRSGEVDGRTVWAVDLQVGAGAVFAADPRHVEPRPAKRDRRKKGANNGQS